MLRRLSQNTGKRELTEQLRPNEEVVALFEPNLDPTLRFGSGIVVLTNLGVIAKQPVPEGDHAPSSTWLRWELAEIREIKKAGSSWARNIRTAGAGAFAASLVVYGRQHQVRQPPCRSKLKLLKAGKSEETELSASICPSCGGAMMLGTDGLQQLRTSSITRHESITLAADSFCKATGWNDLRRLRAYNAQHRSHFPGLVVNKSNLSMYWLRPKSKAMIRAAQRS